MLWATSPACTELETHVLDWLVELLDLPERFLSTGAGGGVIQDSASRRRSARCWPPAQRAAATRGADLGDLRGLHLHPGPLLAGEGGRSRRPARRAGLRLIAVDETFAMRPDALRAADRPPTWPRVARRSSCCATVGTTSSLAVDPVAAIGEVAAEHGVWLHVDGAMAGTAAVCPSCAGSTTGLEQADSYAFNPHKWLFTNFDCDCFWVADRAAADRRAVSILPEYLRNAATESGAVIDYRDWHVPLGRRFRALKLWFVIRHYGVEGLGTTMSGATCRWPRRWPTWVDADPRFELAAPPRPQPGLLPPRRRRRGHAGPAGGVNASGEAYLTHTRLDDRFVLRLCVGQTNTEQRHVRAVWDHLIDPGRRPSVSP